VFSFLWLDQFGTAIELGPVREFVIGKIVVECAGGLLLLPWIVYETHDYIGRKRIQYGCGAQFVRRNSFLLNPLPSAPLPLSPLVPPVPPSLVPACGVI
jgi:hypothetical protein